jgi:FixJ family two-component response regulator
MAEAGARRILVVDDDASVRRALARLLGSFGFEVQTYASGAELLAAGPPADTLCLVADVRMPDMGGVELCERLLSAGHDVPTVLVTGHGGERPTSPAVRDAPLLEKPITAQHLVEAIDAAASRRRLRAVPGPGPQVGTK